MRIRGMMERLIIRAPKAGHKTAHTGVHTSIDFTARVSIINRALATENFGC